jgi:hypothetical protein
MINPFRIGFDDEGLPLDDTTPDEAERQFFEKADLDYESRFDK